MRSPEVIRTRKTLAVSNPTPKNDSLSATVTRGQHVPAKQQVTVNIKAFDLRAVVIIHVGEHSAEPFDTLPLV